MPTTFFIYQFKVLVCIWHKVIFIVVIEERRRNVTRIHLQKIRGISIRKQISCGIYLAREYFKTEHWLRSNFEWHVSRP